MAGSGYARVRKRDDCKRCLGGDGACLTPGDSVRRRRRDMWTCDCCYENTVTELQRTATPVLLLVEEGSWHVTGRRRVADANAEYLEICDVM